MLILTCVYGILNAVLHFEGDVRHCAFVCAVMIIVCRVLKKGDIVLKTCVSSWKKLYYGNKIVYNITKCNVFRHLNVHLQSNEMYNCLNLY